MSTHDGFIQEFPAIRCDRFTPLAHPTGYKGEMFYLLTHCHSDHLVGLNSPQFDGVVYTTAVTKAFVSKLTTAKERTGAEVNGTIAKKIYANLGIRPGLSSGRKGRTLLERMVILEYNVPFIIDGEDEIAVTAINANHCPGAAMFLVQGLNSDGIFKSVLITGDIRAEPAWVDQLKSNPALSRFIDVKGKGKAKSFITLDRIYLDTSMTMSSGALSTREDSVKEAIRVMKEEYPEDTRFFINSWSWGYEELLKGIEQAFDTKVHLDLYKRTMYQDPSVKLLDPVLHNLGTKVADSSRFHACERDFRCEEVWSEGKDCRLAAHFPQARQNAKKYNVVRVLPEDWGLAAYQHYRNDPNRDKSFMSISMPCHSTLPESQAFVKLFRPHSLFPLVIYQRFSHYDYLVLPRLFQHQLSPTGFEQLTTEALVYFYTNRPDVSDAQINQELETVLQFVYNRDETKAIRTEMYGNAEEGMIIDEGTATPPPTRVFTPDQKVTTTPESSLPDFEKDSTFPISKSTVSALISPALVPSLRSPVIPPLTSSRVKLFPPGFESIGFGSNLKKFEELDARQKRIALSIRAAQV